MRRPRLGRNSADFSQQVAQAVAKSKVVPAKFHPLLLI